MQTPIPRLFTTPGFSEASARAALEAAERKVMSLQRFIKRTVEAEVFNRVLRDAGYSVTDAEVKLNWGQPGLPELRISDMLLAYEKGAIDSEELRNMLVKSGWELKS